jgi:hypothetical protein
MLPPSRWNCRLELAMKTRVLLWFLLSLAFVALGAGAAGATRGSHGTLAFLTTTELALKPGERAHISLVVGGKVQPITFDVDGIDRSAFTVAMTDTVGATGGSCADGPAAPTARAFTFPFCVSKPVIGSIVSFDLSASKHASGSGVLVAVGASDGALASRNVSVSPAPVASRALPASLTTTIHHSDQCAVFDLALVTSKVEAIASGPGDVALVTLTNEPGPGCSVPTVDVAGSPSSKPGGTTTTTKADPAKSSAAHTYLGLDPI